MKLFTQMTKMAVLAASISFTCANVAAEPMDLDSLLKNLEQGKSAQSVQNTQREQQFTARQNEQVQMLKDTQAKRSQMLSESERLETQFEENEIKLANLTDTLSKRMGSLKELFGVLQQVAGDSSNKFATSVVSAEIPGRSVFMDDLAQKMGSTSQLASIEDIEKVWYELQREMTEQGKVSRFNTQVIIEGGNKAEQEVVRVGAFNLISNGKYLEYSPSTNTLSELTRQPVSRYTSTAGDLQQAKNGIVQFALDPTGGSILGLLVQAPDTAEQVHQGGAVGYVILGVGLLALLIAIERFVSLLLVGGKIRRQLKDTVARDDNPLGRVRKVKDEYQKVA